MPAPTWLCDLAIQLLTNEKRILDLEIESAHKKFIVAKIQKQSLEQKSNEQNDLEIFEAGVRAAIAEDRYYACQDYVSEQINKMTTETRQYLKNM